MILPAMLLAAIAEAAQESSRRGRVQELKGRLGMARKSQPTGTAARLAWVHRTFPPIPEGSPTRASAYDQIVASWLRTMGIDPSSTTASPIDYAIPWLARQAQGVLTDPDYGFPSFTATQYREIGDWLAAERRSLEGLSLFDASFEATVWHLDLEGQAEESGLDEEAVSILEGQATELELQDGWRLVRLQTPGDLTVEGDTLGHCLATGNYARRLSDDDWRYFSLRDPDGIPRVTIEAEKWEGWSWPGSESESPEPVEVSLWSPRQVRGRGNQLPVTGSASRPVLEALDRLNPIRRTWGPDGLSLLEAAEIKDLIEEERRGGGGLEVEALYTNISDGIRSRLTQGAPNLWRCSDLKNWEGGDLLLLLMSDDSGDRDAHTYILIDLNLTEDDYYPDTGVVVDIRQLSEDDENLEEIHDQQVILRSLDPAPMRSSLQAAIAQIRATGLVASEVPFNSIRIKGADQALLDQLGRDIVDIVAEKLSQGA